MALYKCSEWEDIGGNWYVEDTSQFPKNVDKWIVPSRILGITPVNFIELIIKDYNAKIHHNKDCSLVYWTFSSLNDARKYKNWINKKAREKNFII